MKIDKEKILSKVRDVTEDAKKITTDISVKTYEPVYKNNTVQEGSTSEPIDYSNYIFEINY